MRIAVVGAGAIGGYLGARLAAGGEEVTFIARGASRAAISGSGIHLVLEDGTELHSRNVGVFESARDAGVHDLVLLAVKAHQVAAVAPDIHFLCDARTPIVTLQNGIPWWYFHKLPGPLQGQAIQSADPGGVITAHIDPERIIGSVVYPAASLTAPGVVKVIEGNRLALGELDGATTPRLEAIAACLSRAGFRVHTLADIRSEIWLKLLGNLAFNPLSALTHATLVDICRFPPTRALATEMMGEAKSVASKLGVTLRVGIERRIAGAEKVGAHKTSMLQDVEQGRPIELEALVGAVVELGILTGTPTPCIGAVLACASLLAKTLDAQRGQLRIETRR